MRLFISFVCLSMVVLFVSAGAFAATIHVPADYSTIQAAIDAVDPNDGLNTIIVSPGTYYENINFNGKDIILTSTDPADPNIIASTTIDGGGSGSVVTFSGSETAACELRGFAIRNGRSSFDGGGIRGNGNLATISHCFITDNRTTNTNASGGGLAYCDGTITDCRVSNNYADEYGGGFYVCDGSIIRCVISDNSARWRGGGGVCL